MAAFDERHIFDEWAGLRSRKKAAIEGRDVYHDVTQSPLFPLV